MKYQEGGFIMAFISLVYGWLVGFTSLWASIGNFFWQLFNA